MPLHGGARRNRLAGFDGAQDLFVLALEQFEVRAVARRCGRTPDGAARNDETAEIFEETPELRIAGGVGDRAMEGEVLLDRDIAARDRLFDGGVAFGDLS